MTPVCKDFAEAAAEGISSQTYLGAAEGKWDWDLGLGINNPMPQFGAHDVTQLFSPDGRNLGHFDPWWRFW